MRMLSSQHRSYANENVCQQTKEYAGVLVEYFQSSQIFIHFTFQEYNNMAHQGQHSLKRTLADVLDNLDDIKTSITDQQYNELCKKLKTAHDLVPTEATNEYELTILSFSITEELDVEFVEQESDPGEYEQIERDSYRVVTHQTHHRIQLRLQEFMEISAILRSENYISLNPSRIHGNHSTSKRTRDHLEHVYSNLRVGYEERVWLDYPCDSKVLFMPFPRVLAIEEV